MTKTTEHDRKRPQASTKKTRNKVTYVPEPLPETGLVRLPTVLAAIKIARSSWWLGVKEGRFPQPIKLGPRTTVWRAEDIRRLIETGAAA